MLACSARLNLTELNEENLIKLIVARRRRATARGVPRCTVRAVRSRQHRHGQFYEVFCGGRGEIRTLDTLRYTRVPGVRTRPLCDPSSQSDPGRIAEFSCPGKSVVISIHFIHFSHIEPWRRGSALAWGARGRGFKSHRLDQDTAAFLRRFLFSRLFLYFGYSPHSRMKQGGSR
jgi:hypothetical protein